jgi:predicted phosphodiesterase
MRGEALAALHGVELILHAGDVGTVGVLRELRGMAPVIERRGTTLIVNPGAAGPRRFSLQPSVGLLLIEDSRATAEIIKLR